MKDRVIRSSKNGRYYRTRCQREIVKRTDAAGVKVARDRSCNARRNVNTQTARTLSVRSKTQCLHLRLCKVPCTITIRLR
jgi:hypothetical protein